MRARITIVLAAMFAATSSSALGQTSELYINESDSDTMVVVQNGSVVRSWQTVNPGENALAVSNTIRTAQVLIDGHEYDLSGNLLGATHQIPVFFGPYYDGTTDGVDHNYAMVYNDPAAQGQLFRFDRAWANAEPVGNVHGFFGRAVAFDPITETIWYASNAVGPEPLWLRSVDLAGNSVSSFTVPDSHDYAQVVTGLAFDPADGTLWVGESETSLIRQFDLTGALLDVVDVPGITGAYGMEFAVPEPSTALLLGFGVLGLVRRRRPKIVDVQMSNA